MAYSNPATRSDTAKTGKGAVKATTASAILIAANGDRITAYVTNIGGAPVYLAFGATATVKEGIRLNKESLPFRIEGYSGVVSVVAESEEPIVTFSEV